MTPYLVLWIVGAVVLVLGFALETGILTFLAVPIAAAGFGAFARRGQGTSSPG